MSLFEQVEEILSQDVGVEKRERQTMGIKARECGALRKWSSLLLESKVHGGRG